MTGGQLPTSVSVYFEAEALRRTFPGWTFSVHVFEGDRTRIEAVSAVSADPCALISSDPADIWRELSKV